MCLYNESTAFYLIGHREMDRVEEGGEGGREKGKGKGGGCFITHEAFPQQVETGGSDLDLCAW